MTNETIPVPCGKCPACVARQVSAWSFRLCQEGVISSSAWFITLTYSTTHVPITRAGYMSCNKKDVQNFMKRLRKAHPPNVRLKYFLAAEYGGKTQRPHYHLILFNADVSLIQSAWDLGNVHYGSVTPASIGYCLKYISKGRLIPSHKNDDREPEFRLMSKRLGANYLTDNMVKWHKADLENRMYCNLQGGQKISMPRYYKDKIYSEQERKRVAFFSRLKMIHEQLERERKGGPLYWRNLSEAHIAAFNRMRFHSKLTDKL